MTFETFGSVGIDVEHHHANRVAVPSAHQLSDSGFVVGAVEIGLCERSTEPAIVVDDDVIVLALTVGPTVPLGAMERSTVGEVMSVGQVLHIGRMPCVSPLECLPR